jgi:anthranilate synthase component I
MVRHDGIIRVVSGERFTPYSLAKKLNAKAILESSSFQKGKERYSILLVREAFRLTQQDHDVFMLKQGKRSKVKSPAKDILDVLNFFANQHPPVHQDIPVPTGGIGYLSYEFAARCDDFRFTNKADTLGLPDAAFIFGHVFVVFDHYTDILYLIGINYNESEIDVAAAIDEVEAKLNDLDFNYLAAGEVSYQASILDDEKAIRESYVAGVARVQEEIVAGNLLQGVLSRRMRIKTDMPAIEAYKSLRTANPSPYLFFLDFDEYQLFGSSPEMHVKVREGAATIHPIAGTRRRGKNAGEDEILAKELLADEKERAEHLMLVDLARNDLGRFCVPGSVEVSRFMEIQNFSHVMHIVSETKGILQDGFTGADAIRATFPAGTVSGAPKIKAVAVIDRLEPDPRRFYAGLVGYMETGGDLDTCITIRSALKKDGNLILQAGAGIVYDSKPEREFEETNEKLRALAASAGVEV